MPSVARITTGSSTDAAADPSVGVVVIVAREVGAAGVEAAIPAPEMGVPGEEVQLTAATAAVRTAANRAGRRWCGMKGGPLSGIGGANRAVRGRTSPLS